VLVMTVDPGFGHQQFLHMTLPKISRVRDMIDRLNPRCDLEVDGGIDPETAQLTVEADANVLVAGSAVLGIRGEAAEMASMRASLSSSVYNVR
jgi:ribulose-phosphate 3-epimerase